MSVYLKTLKKSFLIAGAILAMSGCKIDTDPLDKYTDVAVYQNPANIRLYIIGMYAEFGTFKFGTFPIGYDNATDALTDIMKYSSGVSGNGTVNILASDASRVSAAGPMLNYWTSAYVRIRRLNEFLEGLDTKAQGLDEGTKLKFQAEARFIRGYVYFWLARLHGSVILLDKLTSEKDKQRSSEDDCWNFIAADFAFAAEYLPKTWDSANTGRVTKGAAYGMLARTWLYAASIAEYDKKQFNSDELTGVPAAKATAYYTNASKAADEVKKLAGEGLYDLDANFASVFTNKNTKEAIFKIDFIRPQLTHQYDLGFAPPKDAPGQVLVYGVPTAELVDEFEMSDGSKFSWSNPTMAANPYVNREQRFNASILFNGSSWKGRTINTTPGDAVEGITEYGASTDPKKTVSGYYTKKFLDPLNTDIVVNKSDQSWMELRYAEVLLIDAEAKSKINDIPGAKASLNTLRNKRGLPNTPSQTPAELMQAVEHERKVELAFEGHRYWDLRRWRKAHVVLNNVRFTGHKGAPNGSSFTYSTVPVDNANRQFTPALYYIPIPQEEILRNNAITQIKGW
ncbi:MAG: RagB/SusD family nutrient uptake outer membrane protein [Candidatus Pedobacter colombiensis]|uniref:RagB/SusD family nutrient uptake outer membrane protein n=1 Tax=Candidatus Pedobacter colombiensis TaxID=3121371 RepID=A0AAJ5WCH7_9SPHI|nr:RagB/SusD family nutrient uptake outer membrane protein [Pedobacter sp.]WEK21755.1 MAG: RagB/SusD family nutrient uptake outer membrane protein [Pedobacter sp.]